MISRPQIFRNRKLLVVHKRFSWRGKVIHRRLRRSTRLPRRRINNFEMGISGFMVVGESSHWEPQPIDRVADFLRPH